MTPLLIKAIRRARQNLLSRARPHGFYPYLFRSSWHALLSRSHAARPEPNYLTALPNPGAGFGHQMANWVAGYWFARLLGCRYAHAPFPDPEWEALLGFGQDETGIGEVRDAHYRRVRLPLFDEDDPAEIDHIRRIVRSYANKPTLFVLELDQFLREQSVLAADLSAKFAASAARRQAPLVYDPSMLNIAVHVRRGDVSRDAAAANPNIMLRWQEVDYFERVLDRVMQTLPDPGRACVHIFSQGRADEFASFAHHPNVRLCLDMDAQASFLHLAAADLLIASKSGFSYGAALLMNGVRVMPVPFWHDYPDDPRWVLASSDGDVDADGIIGALDAAGKSGLTGHAMRTA